VIGKPGGVALPLDTGDAYLLEIRRDGVLVDRPRSEEIQAGDRLLLRGSWPELEAVRRKLGLAFDPVAADLSGNPDDAADLSQEAFLRVYRHLGKFRGQCALKSWIYRVTLNHCRSRLGRLRLPSQPIERDDERAVEDPRRGPEAHALAHDAERRVAEALTQVKASFREAVVLRDLEGLSYAEIAEVLSVRVGTVRSRIARGRDQLRVILEKQS